MTEEKWIEEMACKNCIHYEVCMYVNAQAVEYARAANCKLFKNNAGYRKQSVGEWKYPPYAPFGGSYEMKRCSVCGYRPDFDSDNPYTKFCPECGAKMKGGAE